MLGIDRGVARYVWTAVLILALLIVLYRIRETLLIFTASLLFAYLLWPLVNYLNRRLPGRSRALGLAIVYLALVGLLITLGIEIGSRVVAEANAFAAKVPELLSRLQSTASPPEGSVKATLLAELRKHLVYDSRDFLSLVPQVAVGILSQARSLIFIALVPILSFFFLKDGHEIRSSLLEVFAQGARRELVQDIVADLHVLLAQYMRALVLLASTVSVADGLFLSLIGAPYAILLAAIAFPLEFIPMIGPFAAAVLILLVASLSGFPHLLWILIFLAAFRLFQDYVVSPHLMSSGMQLHPLLVIFGVLAGGHLAGIAGSFLSVPVMATLRIIYRRRPKKSGVWSLESGVRR